MPILSTAITTLARILFAPEYEVNGYLDPGSGSFILQVILASALGVLFVLRGYIAKFFALFRKSSNDKDKDVNEEE